MISLELTQKIRQRKWSEIPDFLKDEKVENFFKRGKRKCKFLSLALYNDAPVEIIKLILGAYSEALSEKTSAGWTPLHIAVVFSSEEVVKYVLSEAKDLTCCGNESGNTPLHLSLSFQHNITLSPSVNVISSLILANPSVMQIRNKSNQTPADLFFSSWHNHIQNFLTLVSVDSSSYQILNMSIPLKSPTPLNEESTYYPVRGVIAISMLLLQSLNRCDAQQLAENRITSTFSLLQLALVNKSCPHSFTKLILLTNLKQLYVRCSCQQLSPITLLRSKKEFCRQFYSHQDYSLKSSSDENTEYDIEDGLSEIEERERLELLYLMLRELPDIFYPVTHDI